jgi:glycosyltransferase involved in cell wall biosynthesis
VVSTSVGAEGLPCRGGEQLLIADGPDAFAGAIARLLSSPELRTAIGRAGRAMYEEQFHWEAGWERLREAGV